MLFLATDRTIGRSFALDPVAAGLFLRLLAAGLAVLATLSILAGGVALAAESRIKDIADFEGIRDNQLVGYGLVVGLDGSGDSLNNSPFTRQSLQAMLERFGINVRAASMNTENVAALIVTTNLPFNKWTDVFHDATAAAAVIDRIVHHATVIKTEGKSYRLREAQKQTDRRILGTDRFELVEVLLDHLPRPVQGRGLDRRGIDEDLVWHQPGALVGELESAEGVLLAGVVAALVLAEILDVLDQRRVFVDHVDVHRLEQRRVGIRQPNLELVGIVDVPVGPVRGVVPDVVASEIEALAADNTSSVDSCTVYPV